MKTKLQVDYRLVQLTKRSLSDDELAKLVEAGAYGVGSDKRLIIESDEANHRHGVSDFVSRIHRFIIDWEHGISSNHLNANSDMVSWFIFGHHVMKINSCSSTMGPMSTRSTRIWSRLGWMAFLQTLRILYLISLHFSRTPVTSSCIHINTQKWKKNMSVYGKLLQINKIEKELDVWELYSLSCRRYPFKSYRNAVHI